MNKLAALAGSLVLIAAWSSAALADEAKTPIRASLLMSISSPITETRDAAFDRAMKEPAPPAPRTDGEIQPDGSVRYGNVTITVRNPCPPGTHFEPPPLPGRVRK
ncbi:MAG TPA: hypothetical protein VFE97_13700 [Methylomirabilota bacterium]|jgi:hypothetical protein|nr:hypothetical protein [Methylomirabilota bacterium]